MTTLILMAALVLADGPSPTPPPRPAPPAAPTAEELYILVLKQRADELKRHTAVAEMQYQFAARLLDGVKAKWAESILQPLMTAQGRALIAEIRADDDHYQAQAEMCKRQDAQRNAQWDLRSKVFKQHIAMYDAIAILRGIRAIANHFIDPVTEPFLGRGQSIIPFPEVPPLPPVPPEPSPPPK